ncbi:hypothetical protein [Wolbachia endosymbiont of Ctenocephalides felis wCfeT]|uniref:hypothetical protein n=1 Tax=Wolbachia endosymbiont of Ctenocephalides felis wCfeT TaxID=2732593 RepID=UPI001446868E|nr:hypothetical protein [Wolbachia endosymbiont of Ctenocephalides felis wCfeT]
MTKEFDELRKAIFFRNAKAAHDILDSHRKQDALRKLFNDSKMFNLASGKGNNAVIKEMQKEQAIVIACGVGATSIVLDALILSISVILNGVANSTKEETLKLSEMFDFPAPVLYTVGAILVLGAVIAGVYNSREMKTPNTVVGENKISVPLQAGVNELSSK